MPLYRIVPGATGPAIEPADNAPGKRGVIKTGLSWSAARAEVVAPRPQRNRSQRTCRKPSTNGSSPHCW